MNKQLDDASAIKVVELARAILREGENGGPLFQMHRHYPTRWEALEYGFFLTWGVMTAFSAAMLAVSAVKWVLS